MKTVIDSKKNHYGILVWGLVIMSLVIPCVAAIPPQTGHPYMLFHEISDVPGYQYRTMDPWKGWESSIISGADASLKKDFSGDLGTSNRIIYRASSARNLGLAYQITKKPAYAEKAKEAILNMYAGGNTTKTDRAGALAGFSYAYDWIQPTLDPKNDSVIRDKLAGLADSVYKDLNDGGKNTGYISFVDYHGQAYPNMGVVSAALADYKNPNNLPLKSTPADWHKVGTEYLFENDLLHKYGRSMFSYGFDEASGKNLLGAYKSYVMDDMVNWFQVYSITYNENIFEKYPAAKRAFTSEIWESLPNQLSNNYVTNGNTGWAYHKGIVSLLPDSEKPEVLNHLNRVSLPRILPQTSVWGGTSTGGIATSLLYCVYGNYNSLPRTFPTVASHLDENSIYQVVRGGWADDSDWLSLITFNTQTNSNRDMAHQDQMSIEYYSRGDLLLADGGEPKHVIGGTYGTTEISHNSIAIEDPRSPFPISSWSGSSSQGIFKGNAQSIKTPVTVDTIIQTPWIQLIQTQASVTKVLNGVSSSAYISLTSPVSYERSVLYPDNDYFIIIDRMEGTQPWTFRNIFRPSSLMVTPTVDTNKDGIYQRTEVGSVNGDLVIGGTSYDWKALDYKIETPTGITTSSLVWKTTNPYGNGVTLNLVSSPSSEILVEKNAGRIGGYEAKSEVGTPVVYFKPAVAESVYRVTALLSSYASEEAKTASEIDVTGTGHALKIQTSNYDDYIYTGKGISSFGPYTTDANTVYIRKSGSDNEFTLMDGSYLKKDNTTVVSISTKVDYFTLKQDGNVTKFSINGESSADITLPDTMATRVLRDGTAYPNWVMDVNTLKISTTLSEHDFEVSSVGGRLSIDPIADKTVNVSERVQIPVNITYTGNGVLQSDASNLPKYSAFNSTSRIFTWTPYANQTGNYTVRFNVTDGLLSDSGEVRIRVNTLNRAPVLEVLGNMTANVRSELRFTVNATDADGDILTYSATGVPANATFTPDSQTFVWTPYTNQTGNYTVRFNVTDGMLSDSGEVLIRVDALNRAPVFASITDASVNQKEVLTMNVTASDPDGDILTYSATGLPAGAGFNAVTRQFTWSPAYNQVGNHTVTFSASDGSLTTSGNVTFTAVKVNYAPYFTLGDYTKKTIFEGRAIRLNINAADWNQDIITYSATNLPEGAKVDSATHTFSWTPGFNQADTYDITLIVSDGKLQNSKLLRIIVLDSTKAPVFEPIMDASVNQNETLTISVAASDPDGDLLTYSAANLPAGAVFDPLTRQFSWSPSYDQVGAYVVTFNAHDGSLTTSINVTFTSVKVNYAPYFILGDYTKKTIFEGRTIRLNINAADWNQDIITYSATNLPEGAKVDSATHTFSWTPGYTQAGTHRINLIVSDGSLSSSKILEINVLEATAPESQQAGKYYIKLE